MVSRLGHISGHFGREPGRLSQVSGEPSCAFALLSDPAGADRPAMADGPCRSPSIDRESHPAAGIFRGSITRLRHPPPTLPASIALHGQGWLPAAWLAVPGGVRLHGLHPLGSFREFQWQFPCLSPPFAPVFAWRDDPDSDPDNDWGASASHPSRSSVLRAGQGCSKIASVSSRSPWRRAGSQPGVVRSTTPGTADCMPCTLEGCQNRTFEQPWVAAAGLWLSEAAGVWCSLPP